MALENVMRVDNGNIVSGGGAGESSVEIDWKDWCELTPEEQETGDWTIINCPWADGNVSVDLMTKLWENPNPSASFVAQDIQLSSNNYDLLLVISFYSYSADYACPTVIGLKGYINFADYGTAALNTYRGFVSNGTTVTFRDCYRNRSVSNEYLIPYQIYGIKLTATVKINAIAMDVKASVEYSTSEHLIGKWIDGSDLYEKTIDFGSLPNSTQKQVQHDIANIKNIIDMNAVCTANVGNDISVVMLNFPAGSNHIRLSATKTYISIVTTYDVSNYSVYVTMRYTKNS